MNTHKHTLSCLTILVVLNFCGIVQRTRQVSPALCSVVRRQRGAGQMAPSTMFPHCFHFRNWSDWSLYLSSVLSVQWKSWFTWMKGRDGAPHGSRPIHFRQTRSPRQITRWHEWFNHLSPFFITLTCPCYEPHARSPPTPDTFNFKCSELYNFVALNSTVEISQWREAKSFPSNSHRKIKQGRKELWNLKKQKD